MTCCVWNQEKSSHPVILSFHNSKPWLLCKKHFLLRSWWWQPKNAEKSIDGSRRNFLKSAQKIRNTPQILISLIFILPKNEIRFWKNQTPSYKIKFQYQTDNHLKFKKLPQKFQEYIWFRARPNLDKPSIIWSKTYIVNKIFLKVVRENGIYSKKITESKSKYRNAFSVLLIGRVGIDCDFRQSILPVVLKFTEGTSSLLKVTFPNEF